MEHDSDCTGHLPSHIPLMGLFGSPVQNILCPTSLVFARPTQKPAVNCSLFFRSLYHATRLFVEPRPTGRQDKDALASPSRILYSHRWEWIR